MFAAKRIALCLYGQPECIFPFEVGKLSFSLPYSTKLYNYFRAVHTLNSVFMPRQSAYSQLFLRASSIISLFDE
ncbi:hypothetical protein, partial [Kaistella sp.]|uniref:hypothetical protein n=1 Tax=Kaistella sp. TaxID=2782235 RepID=UPI002F957E5E